VEIEVAWANDGVRFLWQVAPDQLFRRMRNKNVPKINVLCWQTATISAPLQKIMGAQDGGESSLERKQD